MIYRLAKRSDLETFLDLRMEFLEEVSQLKDPEGFRAASRRYLEAHMEGEDLLIFVAEENSRLAAGCAVCLTDALPLPSCPAGRRAELLSVYTRPQHRRQGHGERLLRLVLRELEARGAELIRLHATEAGYPMYGKLGFQLLDREMEYRLREPAGLPRKGT